MKILAFDTTSSFFSVAIAENDQIIAKKIIEEAGKQAEFLVLEIEKILESQGISYQDLDLVAVTNGPGSFTGSRIGLVVGRTIKLATKVPLILLNSCEVIAYKYRQKSEKIIAAMDAAMGESFCAQFSYKDGILTTIKEPFLSESQDLSQEFLGDGYFLCGSGKSDVANVLKDKIKQISQEEDRVEAPLIALLAYDKFKNGEETDNLNPLYLRNPKIEKRKK